MANIPSQIKRNRQNEKRRLRNRDFRGAARTAVKDVLTSISTGEQTASSILTAISALDRAARRGAIHHRNAARRKGRLMKRLSALGVHPQVGDQAGLPGAQPVGAPASSAPKPSAKAGKRAAPATETKSKSETRKPTAKSTTKKPAPKKTAKK